MSACLTWEQWAAERKTRQQALLDQEDVKGWPEPCSCGAGWRRSPKGRWEIIHRASHPVGR